MNGRSATVAAVAVALIGIVGFFLLEGVGAGLVILVAGVLLLVIGLVGWRDRAPALATGGAAAVSTAEVEPVRLPEADVEPGDADAAPGERGVLDEEHEPIDVSTNGDASRIDGLQPTPAAASTPEPALEPDPATDAGSDVDGVLDRDYAPAPDPTMPVVGDAGGLDHLHDAPLLGHSDLVSHVRDDHEEIAQVGSTIQLRLLHERAHGAPHEPPVNLKTG